MAQRHIIDTYVKADTERRQAIAEECERWEEIRATLIEWRADAEKTGRPPRMCFPHPDDIVIDPERGVRFVGPMNEEEQAQLEDSIRIRDLLLVQDHYDHRECKADDLNDPDRSPDAAAAIMHTLNGLLPRRYRLSDSDIVWKTMQLIA